MGRRVAYLVSHPIQYQAPLLRYLNLEDDLEVEALFLSDHSLHQHQDEGFGTEIDWDIPLTGDYPCKFLSSLDDPDHVSFWRPVTTGIRSALEKGDYDALWVHGYAHHANLRAIWAAKSLGMKVLLRGESNLHTEQGRPLKTWFKRRLLHRVFDKVDAFLAIGTWNRRFYLDYGVPEEDIYHVPYAADNDFWRERCQEASKVREEFRAELGLEADRSVILYASKLTPRKAPDDLLEAYARLSPDGEEEPEPYLLYVGDGKMRPALEERAGELGWDSIRFLGFQNQTQLPRYYDLCDVFVLPSHYEPWGLVVNEVMNAGKPVVVSDMVGAGVDLVEEEENGFVFEAGNVSRLSSCLRSATSSRITEKDALRVISSWGFGEDVQGLQSALSTGEELAR